MKNRKKGDQEVPTEKQIAEITEICDDYRLAMNRISENRNRIEELCSRLDESMSEFETSLINDDIDKIKMLIQEDEEKTSYFRWALYYLDDQGRSVMRQLYVEGYGWNSVIDEKGKLLSPGAVGRIRMKSIYEMAEKVAQKRKEEGKRSKSHIKRKQLLKSGAESGKNGAESKKAE